MGRRRPRRRRPFALTVGLLMTSPVDAAMFAADEGREVQALNCIALCRHGAGVVDTEFVVGPA
jgi:hypothetical protein